MRINNGTFDRAVSTLDVKRTRFLQPTDHKTTFNEGQLIPIFCKDVLPGDTWNIKQNSLIRLSTLLTPIMGDLYLDTYYFFVPNRIIWEHWQEFMGQVSDDPWQQETEYNIPQTSAPSGGWKTGTIADYLGIRPGIDVDVSSLRFRAYTKIVSDWFINQNLQTMPNLSIDDSNITGTNGSTPWDPDDYITDLVKGGIPFNAGKYNDYFVSNLPSPQRGQSVKLPLGDNARVYPSVDEFLDFDFIANNSHSQLNLSGQGVYLPPMKMKQMRWKDGSGNIVKSESILAGGLGVNANGEVEPNSTTGAYSNLSSPINLMADLSSATATTINQLRLAFQLQKMMERSARGGSRYTELVKAAFGVISPDARLQRSEFLGGDRCLLNVQQVVQTSATEAGSTAKGSTSAYSLTFSSNNAFTKSFTEHGYIMGLAVVRHKHVYQQGIERDWFRKTKYDFYDPILSNIGEVATLNREIFAQGTSADTEVFGYNEAWADYRYTPSRVSGEFRSDYSTSLDSWHLADDYSSLPVLGNEWMQEGKDSLDRCLAVQSSVSNQILADFNFQNTCTRVMPLYSTPGLIDHH